MLKLLKIIGILLGGAYCIALLAMYVFQRDLMYFPTHANPSPVEVGLSGVSVEQLPTSDGETIVAWFSAAKQGRPTVLFLHGNGGEIASRADRFSAYQAAGFGVMFVSWRGYGGSSGTPSELGLVLDANTAYDWLVSNGVEPTSIAVVGESLGTGVAVQIAAKRSVGALILGAPYTATSDVAAQRYPWLPVQLLMKDQFRSIEFIDAVTAPTLIIHGTADTVIPFHFGRRLFDAAETAKTFIELEGQGHGLLFQPTTFAREIAFIEGVFPR